MPGIAKINQAQKEQAENRSSTNSGNYNYELSLRRDSDQAIMVIASTGHDEGPDSERIDDFLQHRFQDETNENRWTFAICKTPFDEPCPYCERSIGTQHRFAFWAYVLKSYSKEAGQSPNWKEEKVGTDLMYGLEINNFRVVSLPFGRNDATWQQLVDIYQDYGALNATAIRVKRSGTDISTNWSIAALPKTEYDLKHIMDSADDLSTIKEFYLNQNNKSATPAESTMVPFDSASAEAPKTEIDAEIENLF